MGKAKAPWLLAAAVSFLGVNLWAGRHAPPAQEAPAAPRLETSAQPRLTGTASCSGRACHGGVEPAPAPGRTILRDEYTRWLTNDRHAQAYRVLFNERSVRIARNLNLPLAHKDARCLACHVNPLAAGPQATELVREERVFGVGCESCHGPAKRWLGPHTRTDWEKLTPAGKQRHGMTPVADLSALALACAGCHVGAPPGPHAPEARDVNHDLIAAGHPRLNFELGAFLAHLPPHWNSSAKKRGQDHETRTWAVGQVVSAESALQLLAHRAASAKTAPWPEFAEYDCYACHHDLRQPSWRQARGYGKRLPGSLPWSDWYEPMPGLLTDGRDAEVSPKLMTLRREMEKPLPNRKDVGEQARAVAGLLEKRRERVQTEFGRKEMRALLLSVAAKRPQHAGQSWDAAEQLYLALCAMNQDDGNPQLLEALRAIDAERRGLQPGFDSPRRFQPDRFLPALDEALGLLHR